MTRRRQGGADEGMGEADARVDGMGMQTGQAHAKYVSWLVFWCFRREASNSHKVRSPSLFSLSSQIISTRPGLIPHVKIENRATAPLDPWLAADQVGLHQTHQVSVWKRVRSNTRSLIIMILDRRGGSKRVCIECCQAHMVYIRWDPAPTS